MISIVEINRGHSTYAWLCEACQQAAIADNWSVKVVRDTSQRCDWCPRPAPPAVVEFVATSPHARLPTAAECPRPPKIAPWAKPSAAATNQERKRSAFDGPMEAA